MQCWFCLTHIKCSYNDVPTRCWKYLYLPNPHPPNELIKKGSSHVFFVSWLREKPLQLSLTRVLSESLVDLDAPLLSTHTQWDLSEVERLEQTSAIFVRFLPWKNGTGHRSDRLIRLKPIDSLVLAYQNQMESRDCKNSGHFHQGVIIIFLTLQSHCEA